MLCYEIIPLLVWSVLTRAAVIMMEVATVSDLDSGNITPNIPSQHNIYKQKSGQQSPAVLSSAQESRKF